MPRATTSKQSRRRPPCSPGDVIRVPFGEGQALGVIARTDGDNGLLGYFFIGKQLGDLAQLRAEQADLVTQLGDLGVRQGTWTKLGPLPGFQPGAWPVPRFAHQDPVSKAWVLRSYDDALGFLSEMEVSAGTAAKHHKDGISGSGAVEAKLRHVAAARAAARPAA